MECAACGHTWEFDIDTGKWVGEEFLDIEGAFMMEKDMNWGKQAVKVRLMACPKCKTVILND